MKDKSFVNLSFSIQQAERMNDLIDEQLAEKIKEKENRR